MIPAVMSHFFNSETRNEIHEIEGELPCVESDVSILGETFQAANLAEIKNDLKSRLWFTYRKNFANIGGNGPTTDQGWGCMLRAGQMMMGEALIRLKLGREFRWKEEIEQSQEYLDLIDLFRDTHQSLISIQQIALTGATAERRKVGEWFGPNTMAQVLRRISADGSTGIKVAVAMDSVVCRREIRNEMTSRRNLVTPLLLIIPLRLGLETVNDIYIKPLMEFLSDRHCVGIMGGKPNQAHFFIGSQTTSSGGEWLLYLDPHTTQPASVTSDIKEFDNSLHTEQMCWMKANKLDPSLACGFLFQTLGEFDDWCQRLQNGKYVPFGIVEESASRNVAISSTIIAADSDDSASDYEVLDID